MTRLLKVLGCQHLYRARCLEVGTLYECAGHQHGLKRCCLFRCGRALLCRCGRNAGGGSNRSEHENLPARSPTHHATDRARSLFACRHAPPDYQLTVHVSLFWCPCGRASSAASSGKTAEDKDSLRQPSRFSPLRPSTRTRYVLGRFRNLPSSTCWTLGANQRSPDNARREREFHRPWAN